MSNKNKFYLTTPIYYVNDKPHIGHAYTTVVADAMARYQRLLGKEVFFLTGTDEHGAKIEQAAEKAGKTAWDFCNENSAKFQLAWDVLKISNDDFIRTTEHRHKEVVNDLLTKLKIAKTPLDNVAVYEGEYRGLYCVGCEKYITEKDLVDGKCPDHQTVPQEMAEKNWFFRLSDYQYVLKKAIEAEEIQIFPVGRKNEVLSFIEQGLEDIAISRPTVKWGIELPWDKEQTVYVWVEALMNYLSGLPKPTEKFWPADAHLIGKDILKFHAVIWPALLTAWDLPLPKAIVTNGFFNVDGQKMSKSLGNVLDPIVLAEKYGVDAVRYFISREVPYGNDGDISLTRLEERYVSDLQNGLGNLASRVLALAEKEEFVPLDYQVEHEESVGSVIQGKVAQSWDKYRNALEAWQPHEALSATWELIAYCDGHISNIKLWELAKSEQEEFVKQMYNLLETLRHIAWQIFPFMPTTSGKILSQLLTDSHHLEKELAKNFHDIKKWGGLHPTEVKAKKGEMLFPRLEK